MKEKENLFLSLFWPEGPLHLPTRGPSPLPSQPRPKPRLSFFPLCLGPAGQQQHTAQLLGPTPPLSSLAPMASPAKASLAPSLSSPSFSMYDESAPVSLSLMRWTHRSAASFPSPPSSRRELAGHGRERIQPDFPGFSVNHALIESLFSPSSFLALCFSIYCTEEVF